MNKTFLILDGNALLHRAWHAIPPLTTKSGLVVNAAYGFTMILEKMLETHKIDYMAVAWDLRGETFRHKLYKEYKAQREKKEQELYDQIPIIQKILDSFGIPSVSAQGYEADDVIATLSAKACAEKMNTIIVTGDMDSLQLVDDCTSVLSFQKGISETKLYDEVAVKERFGLSPSQLVDYKALRGDPSDNLPGIAGVGEKTAEELLKRYKNIEGIFGALDEIEEKHAKKLRGREDEVERSKELVKLVRDVKIDFDFATAQVRPFDFGKILPLYRDLEFKTLIKKHSSGAVASDEVASADSAQRRILIVNESGVETAFLQFGKQVGTLGVLFAQQNADLFGATLAAICVSNAKHTCVITNPTKTSLKQICDLLSRAELVVVHDAKTLMRILGETISVPIFDTMIASYLLNAGTRSHDLSSAIHSVLGGFVPEMPPTFSKQKDYEAFGKITSVLPELGNKMRRSLEGAGVLKVFDEIESPLTPILYKMENAGIKIDTETLARLSKNFEKKIEELDKKIQSIAGVAFNVNSPSQLADVLFTALKLPTKGIKKTKTGFSTAAPELDKLWDAHEIIPMLSEYRELAKLQSTYVEALPKLITKDGRVHTTYNQTVTATGRLSSSEPNLQNIPVKTELGREIRKAFVAPRGKVLLSADYSQIELRLVAVLSRDAAFINAFKDGSDIHTRTAAEVWGVTEKNVTKQQRAAAKAINFGIIYGMGPRSLARATGFSVDEAQQFIDRYFEIHHSVRDYLDATKLKAHAQGFVETYFGRRRYLPEIESGVQALVSAAERMAINMPVQGTAADIMKMAMLRVDGWLSKSGFDARMLLQVHDEIVLEVDENFVGQVALGVREMMESVAGFEVPLVVDVEEGKNWGEMERVE